MTTPFQSVYYTPGGNPLPVSTPPKPKPMDPYMTVIPTRRPTQKTHANIGHVKNAINAKMSMGSQGLSLDCAIQVYKLDGASIELIYDFPKGTLANDIEWVRQAREKRAEKERQRKALEYSRFESTLMELSKAALERHPTPGSADVYAQADGYRYGFSDAIRLVQASMEGSWNYFDINSLKKHLTKLP